MKGVNFIAIDFETATGSRASICEAGICVVRDGVITETRSWLVRPENNSYSHFNIFIHGITPADTVNAPEFPEVWREICTYLNDCPVLVAHNASFDMSCIRKSLELYRLPKPDITHYCSLRAAKHIYKLKCNKLDFLCDKFRIQAGTHHRAGDDAEMCARLFIREIEDAGNLPLNAMTFCAGKL